MPFVNRSFMDILFKTLLVKDIVAIVTHLMIERSVLLVSPSVETLLPITHALMALLSPFEWRFCMPYIKKEHLIFV